jgi:NADPH:quinone reductase
VLITGAAGGVGRFAVELAARGGAAAVVAIVRDVAVRGAGLTQLGATAVVTAIADAGGEFDIALESVGGATLTQAVNALAADGIAVVFGNSSNEPSTIGFADLRGNPRRRVHGFGVYTSGDGLGDDLGFLVRLVAEGRLHPHVGTPWSWQDGPAALAALRDRKVNGKAILAID